MSHPEPTNIPWPQEFNNIKVGLRREVFAKRNERVFDAARTRQPALADHPGIEAVLGNLTKDQSDKTRTEGIVRALLEEYQRERDPFWSGVLLLAFLLMLARIRKRMVDDDHVFQQTEITSMVFEAFLLTLDEIDVGAGTRLTSLRLRQMTTRQAFALYNAEHHLRTNETPLAPEDMPESDSEDCNWPDPPPFAAEDDPCVADMAVKILFREVGNRLPPGRLELVAETTVRGRRLRERVELLNPGFDGRSLEREIERQKRQRTRSLKTIREILNEKFVPEMMGHAS